MKYLAFIFTIYVMALSVWPCCDDEASFSLKHIEVGYAAKLPCNSHKNTHTCSPFFHCGTCHSFVITPAINRAPSLLASKKKTSFPEYSAFPVILFPGDIWQPPQAPAYAIRCEDI